MRRPLAALVAVAFLLTSALLRGADVPISEEAKRHFRAGVALIDDPDGPRYEEAYREFQAAYRASPSPKILGNLAICAMKLERDGEAIEAFQRYLEGAADVGPVERKQTQRDLTTLEDNVVWLELRISPAGTSLVDERIPVSGPPLVNRYDVLAADDKLGIRRGRHRLTFRKQGYQPHVVELDAEKKTHSLTVELAPLRKEKPKRDEGPPPFPLPAIITASITGAVLIGAAITGGLAIERHTTFDAINDGDEPETAQSIREEGVALSIATDVLLGVAVAGAVTTIVLWLVPAKTSRDARYKAPLSVVRW